MQSEPVSLAADRSIKVPAGIIVKTGYVDIFKIRLACRERMAVGDVSAAYQKVLQLGEHSAYPTPTGFWDEDTFVLQDGRHEWIASVMMGRSHLLVSWLSKSELVREE